MPVLTANDLHKAYGPSTVLDGVSLSIDDDEHVGLVGLNGSGKSTLSKVLAGLELADTGAVAVRRGADVRYLEQEPQLDPQLTARQVVAAGLSPWFSARERHATATRAIEAGATGPQLEALLAAQADADGELERLGGWDQEHRIDTVMSHLGVTAPDRDVGSMSGGERRRVALAQLLVARPALAILDEPTNHLDIDAIEWLEEHLAHDFAGAILLVTHDRYFLDRIVTRTIEIDRGVARSYDGGWQEYLGQKADRLAHEARAESNRQNFVRRELEWLRRGPKARTTKQKARIDRAEAAIEARPEVRRETVSPLKVAESELGGTVLELRHVGIELGGRTLIDDLDLILTQGERIGVIGPNGAGKTSLLRLLTGDLLPTRGEVVRGRRSRVSYLDQGKAALDDDATIARNVAGDADQVTVGGHSIHVASWLERFLFDSSRMRQRVGSLSGGERARVALAKMLLEPANVILLDEPTNDLDVATLSSLEDMLLELSGTAVVVTHDRYFLDRVATAILSFEGDGRVVRYAGNYENYRSQRAAAPAASKGTAPAARAASPSTRATPQREDAPRKLSHAERRELDGLLTAIETAEGRVTDLERELEDPAIYQTRGAEVPVLRQRHADAKGEVDRLMARWEELEARSDVK